MDNLLPTTMRAHSTVLGATTAPTNSSPPTAFCPGATHEPLAQLGASHLLVNTARANESNPHHAYSNPPTGFGDSTPHLAIGRTPSAVRIVCPTVNMKTQYTPVTGCQYQCTYSNNNDNPATHWLPAVSNIAAAGPDGESGPYGHLPVFTVPTADGGMGSRARPDFPPDSTSATIPSTHNVGSCACPEIPPDSTDMTPISPHDLGPCGKPLANTDPKATEWMGPRGSTSTKAARGTVTTW
jgi:hypothetical protein